MKIALLLIFILLFNAFSYSLDIYTPPQGYVPGQETAKKTAEAIWKTMHGKLVLDGKPYPA